jgi:hypothetical protein
LTTIYINRGMGNGDYMINFIEEGIALWTLMLPIPKNI